MMTRFIAHRGYFDSHVPPVQLHSKKNIPLCETGAMSEDANSKPYDEPPRRGLERS
jgi:hypothetical protein